MDSVEFLGYVEVFRKPEYVKSIAWMVVAAAVVAAMAWGLAQGHLYMVVGLAPLGWALAASRRAAASKMTKQVGVAVSFADGVLRMRLPGTRLFDGRYVDQFYMCASGDIDSVAVDESGQVSLRAKRLESFATDGDMTLDHRTNEYCEVSFRADPDGRAAFEAFLGAHGISVSVTH